MRNSRIFPEKYTGYVGCAVTAVIAMNFGTAHGRSRLEVGSAKCIGACGRKRVAPAPLNFTYF